MEKFMIVRIKDWLTGDRIYRVEAVGYKTPEDALICKNELNRPKDFIVVSYFE